MWIEYDTDKPTLQWFNSETTEIIQSYGNDIRYPAFKAKIDSGEIVPIKFEDTDDYIARKAQYDSEDWKRNREAAYASLNQFEMLYDKGMTGWKAEITKIKDLYPKP
jgi:hypothetical protein